MTDDIVLSKISAIKRCLVRINEEFTSPAEFKTNFTKQDSVILNLQRACEAAIDIANYIVRKEGFGVPQSARESFDMLVANGRLSAELAASMKSMVGLRNIAIHNYQQLDITILIAVIEGHLSDFDRYCAAFVD